MKKIILILFILNITLFAWTSSPKVSSTNDISHTYTYVKDYIYPEHGDVIKLNNIYYKIVKFVGTDEHNPLQYPDSDYHLQKIYRESDNSISSLGFSGAVRYYTGRWGDTFQVSYWYKFSVSIVSSCPSNTSLNSSGICLPNLIPTCPTNQHFDSNTSKCICNSGYKLQYEQCVPDCSQNVLQTASAPDGWEKYINIDSAQECASLAKNFDYNQANFSSQTDSRGCVYNVCYVNQKSADINNSTPVGPPNCTEPTVFPDTPYGFILRGTVKSVQECQAFVDNVEYTDFLVIPVTDCSGTYEFCYLKTSIDNNDTGITLPSSDSNDTNISNDVPSATPSLPSTSNNTDLTGVNQKLALNNSLDSIRNQKLDDISDGQGQFKNLMGAWINQSRLDNNNQLNAQRQTASATNRVKSAIDTLNTGLSGKLDTLIENSQKIVDKNNSVDLSGVEDKLDTLHKDLNSSNAKLSKIADAFNTDDNVTYPDTALDDNTSAPSLSDLLPSDSWFSSNTLDLTGFNNYTGDCYLESFSWTDGSGTHTFPPQALMDMIPFNVVSNIMFAFLYLLGLREFLRS